MKLRLNILVTIFIFCSCGLTKNGKETEVKHFYASEVEFSKLVNTKTIPTTPDLGFDIFLENQEYPIELSLYKDGRWYYDLPNLGSGNGTWKFVDGEIKLFAKRSLFDMHIKIISLDEKNETFGITFKDRFGPQFLKMNVINR